VKIGAVDEEDLVGEKRQLGVEPDDLPLVSIGRNAAREHADDRRQLLLPVDDNYFCRFGTVVTAAT
jgi:hypothetical protein